MDNVQVNINLTFQQLLDIIKQLSPADKIRISDELWEESMVEKMSGSLKNKVPENVDWKEIKKNHLKKKYGL